ncbi:hypothetical protein RJ639_015488 [Escallonia herrerae]|uniref:Transposase (putative) gypsy type domain-containing protein n=1 Tax=Escallonia herrerae TaxID=1293975 RepID=A0AA88VF69_9ASTE|nr:hypothetical protein RJ639_015488 [Escallonia herrerae]
MGLLTSLSRGCQIAYSARVDYMQIGDAYPLTYLVYVIFCYAPRQQNQSPRNSNFKNHNFNASANYSNVAPPLNWFPNTAANYHLMPDVNALNAVNEYMGNDQLHVGSGQGLQITHTGDVKDQADDKANPKPWYTADEKSGKMSTEDLQDLIREYPLPEGWYARLPGLQEPANYGTKFETGIYEEQVKSGYRLPLHPFALRFFKHYRMAPRQLVPNGWRKLAGLIHLVQTSGYKPDATDFIRVFFEICFVKGVANCPGWYYIHSRQRLLKGGPKSNKGWHSRYFFVGRLDKGELPFDKDWNPFCKDFKNPGKPTPNNLTKHILMSSTETVPLERSSRILEQVSIDDDPIFRPRWTLRCDDLGMLDSQMYTSGSEMLSRFEMARQVAADEAQQKREAVKEAQEASHRAEELSKQEADHLAQIATLEKRLEQVKRKAVEEVTKARDQGIRDFFDGNTGDEWLKKRADDGLEIYELGFAKAKEMFAERFPDILLDDFVLPAVISPSGKTVLPSEAGDAAASHPPGEGPSGDASEP